MLAVLWMLALDGERKGGRCSPEICLLLAALLGVSARHNLKTIFFSELHHLEEEKNQ